jgi:hypothetical protein
MPTKERVKEFDIERFLILRQAQDEEKYGMSPHAEPVEACGPKFDAAINFFTRWKVGIQGSSHRSPSLSQE